MESVPIIDFSPALTGRIDGLARVAADVQSACETIGFFYIVNHPIAEELVERVFKEATHFFALPEATKRRVSMEQSQHYRGYIPFNTQLYAEHQRGKGGTGFQLHLDDQQHYERPPDTSESFQIHRELLPDDADVLAGKPLHGPNQWPEECPLMRSTLLEYYDAAATFAYLVLEVFALGLGLDRKFFHPYYRKPLMQLRLMHYPNHEPGENVPFGVRPRSDAGAFSMLLQDEVGGLEIRDKAGRWVAVTPIKQAFVVNIGDTMKLWTNNRFQSTRHRVINIGTHSRYSIPFFANPDFDAIIKPITTCVDDAHPPVSDVLHCGESMLHTYSRIWPSGSTRPVS